MVEVVVIAEGPTEEQFIKRLVAPALHHLNIFVKSELMSTSRIAKGGAVTFQRLQFNARNTLRRKSDIILSTFIDLYALNTDFPGINEAKNMADTYSKVEYLESRLHDELVKHIGCRPERFIPHIQPYEYEGLLFSDVEALCKTEPGWNNRTCDLQKVRSSFDTPEHINGGYETAPSKRLEKLLHPGYRKTRHGPLSAERITLATMEKECHHFRGWMENLRGLACNNPETE
jgi:hypothetical protein